MQDNHWQGLGFYITTYAWHTPVSFCYCTYTNITIPIGCIVTQINVSLLSEDPTATATVVVLRDRSVLPFRRDYK